MGARWGLMSLRRVGAGGFEEGDGVVPADVLAGAGEVAEVDEVGAAAEEDVLGVDDFVEGGVGIGVGAAADEGLALEEGDVGAGAGESYGRGEACGACADDEDVRSGRFASSEEPCFEGLQDADARGWSACARWARRRVWGRRRRGWRRCGQAGGDRCGRERAWRDGRRGRAAG